MIKETKAWLLSLLKAIKNTEYDNGKWLLSCKIQTTFDVYKRLI